ncbi:SMP-30/gluconolactonase/LRE family protein [Uliginosibacterium sediminicola]|uniref:SMP-30/gluconolactonase/LRE family protein n=1 Tax=Uliginosibacterium sediminicola TaxID=2024550 RepID=A0ABU9YTB3_9RHOO
MSTRHIEHIISSAAVVALPFTSLCGESPIWSVAEQCFYWVDIPGKRIHRWDMRSEQSQSWQVEEEIGCIALRQGGGLIAAAETGIFDVDLSAPAAVLSRRVSIEHPQPNMRFNDGHCDRLGRLWVSTFMTPTDKLPVGALFRYTPEGLSAPQLPGFMTPNGSAFSPDNRKLYISDSHADVRKVWVVDFDLAAGALGERRLFIDMSPYAGRPDGATIDTDGCYWVAGIDDGCIMRFTPQGKLDRIVRVPMRSPTMCSFGGPDMRQMLITSLQRKGAIESGDVHAGQVVLIDPKAQGIAEVPFAA